MCDTNSVKIENLSTGHCSSVAKLHIDGIRTGFISSLGVDFIIALYKAIAKSKSSFGFMAEKNEKII